MTRKPLVTVVSSYYNRRDFVTESVRSLLEQTYENLEIIIVDDGSSDDTTEMLRALGSDPRLKIISQENKGLVKTFIDVIREAQGELIAIHGSGDISFPTRIEKQVALLTAHDDIGVVGCHVEQTDYVRGTSYTLRRDLHGDIRALLKRQNVYTHGEVMFKKDVYERAGGYREFFKYAQDYDLWLRMSEHTGFSVVKEVLYRRYFLPDGVSRSAQKTVTQRYLFDFAAQCAAMKDKIGRDLLDIHGPQAGFYRERSKRTATMLWRLAITHLVRQNLSEAQLCNEASLREVRGLRNTLTRTGLTLAKRYDAVASLLFRTLSTLKRVRRGG